MSPWASDPWASSPWASLGAEPAANPLLSRPSVAWLFEIFFASSFPITFPWQFDTPPLRVSSLDCYPGQVLGDVLYEGRLLERPQVSVSVPDQYGGGLQSVDGVRIRLAATSTDSIEPDLHAWVAGEHRGKLVLGHLVQLNDRFEAVEVAQNVFRGEIIAMADDPATVDILCRALDLATLVDTVPRTRVSTATYPYADPEDGLGLVTNLGIGIGRRIPCRHVQVPTDVDTSTTLTFTADAGTDLLATSADHLLDTGAGPLRVSSTGTLPGGLDPFTDYWAIATAVDDELRLALTHADAVAGVNIEITSAGSGTHTLTGGLPPNIDDGTVVEVGHGNVGIVRMWLDETADGATATTVPEAPTTYTVLPRTYRSDGRYATCVRFQEPVDGVPVTADVLRVYPDVDAAVASEWKWLRGFEDEVGGRTIEPVGGLTTASLVASHQGFGLGGVTLTASQGFIVHGSDDLASQGFTIAIEFTPSFVAPGFEGSLAQSPRTAFVGAQGWSVKYDDTNQRVKVYLYFNFTLDPFDFTEVVLSSPVGSVPRGVPARLVLSRDQTTGRAELWLGPTLVASDTRPDLISYAAAGESPLLLGILTPAGAGWFEGRLGYVRISMVARHASEVRRAYWFWRRNGIEWCREVAQAAGILVDHVSFDAAAAAWDAIQGGSLRTDGWLTEENALRDVLAAMVPMRDLSFSITAQGRLAVSVPEAPAEVLATFGHGEQFANLLALPTRARASLTEAVRELVVRFRRARNGGGYAREVRRPVHTVGQRELPLEMPFVDDVVAADIVCDWRAKRMRTRDQVLNLVLNHEGRLLAAGDVIRLQVPAMGITDVDAELVQLAKGAERSDARVVPVSAADHVYTPRPLPADPAERLLGLVDLGDAPLLTATLSSGRVLLTFRPGNISILRPVGPGVFAGFTTLAGAPTAWEAVDDLTPDDDASYIESTVTQNSHTVKMAPFVGTGGTIVSVTLHGRLRRVGGSSITARPMIVIGTPPQGVGVYSSEDISLGTSYVDHAVTLTTHGLVALGSVWTVALVNKLEIGYQPIAAIGGALIRVTQLYAEVHEVSFFPPLGGYVQYQVVGPSASEPPPPAETDPMLLTGLDFAPQVVDLSGTSGQKFWFWARAFDELGRQLKLVGPASVTIP